jgi:hypothetical protein
MSARGDRAGAEHSESEVVVAGLLLCASLVLTWCSRLLVLASACTAPCMGMAHAPCTIDHHTCPGAAWPTTTCIMYRKEQGGSLPLPTQLSWAVAVTTMLCSAYPTCVRACAWPGLAASFPWRHFLDPVRPYVSLLRDRDRCPLPTHAYPSTHVGY